MNLLIEMGFYSLIVRKISNKCFFEKKQQIPKSFLKHPTLSTVYVRALSSSSEKNIVFYRGIS